MKLELAVLILDADVQPRETMSSSLIDEYAKLYREGHELPPITVFRDGIDYWVADGFHRVSGAREAGLTELEADLQEGPKREAILYACGSNKHGKTRNPADKQRAVNRLLTDQVWRCWSDKRISLHCGVDDKTVAKYRRLIFGNSEDNRRRTVERNGTVYVMDTSRLTQRELPAEDLTDLIIQQPEVGLELRQQLSDGDLQPDDLSRTEIEALFPSREAPALILTPQTPGEVQAPRTFNLTNDMVDWAKWTWNPVTGCLHDCVYCYARDIATRRYPQKFEPTFLPDRLSAPHHTALPPHARALSLVEQDRAGWRNVFVCSMADLFGKWVPEAWIDAVMTEVRAAPQWNFLFLTKFPQRLVEIDWPDNAWVGTTVDEQYRVKIAEKAFRDLNAPVKWLSCEPLREHLHFSSLDMFDWVVVGGQSASSQAPAFQPPWLWVEDLLAQARAAGCQVYWKPNLTVRPREYPGMAT